MLSALASSPRCVPGRPDYAARNTSSPARRAAPFVGKALALARDNTQGLGSPPDCAVLIGVSPILRTAQYGCGEDRAAGKRKTQTPRYIPGNLRFGE